MDGHLSDSSTAAKTEYDAALAAYRIAQARLIAAKAALKPFLDQEAVNEQVARLGKEAAAVQAWLDGATAKDAAAIAGYKTAGGFSSVHYRLVQRYAPETFLTAYDDSLVSGEWSSKQRHEVERRQALIALTRYYDNPTKFYKGET